jgi:beta-lactamase class A
MISLKSKKFSIIQIILFSAVFSLITCGSVYFWLKKKNEEALISSSAKYCDYSVKRIEGLKYVRPILWVDEACESDNLSGIKQKINQIIEKYKQSNGVTNASVYLRSGGQWTVVNPNEKYEPGSLFKVPVLITILKMDEDNPGFLNKVITYDTPVKVDKNLNYPSKTITLGNSYTIKELLSYMIKYSDNAATVLLERNMKNETLQKLFSDIGVEVPNAYSSQYYFTAKDFSLFMRSIINAGYLTINNSEFAAELLGQSDFKDGIVKGIPANTKIAHKFGESGNQTEKQLHESAIVYIGKKGYLITVMTKGKDIKILSNLIGDISRTVYNDVSNSSK